MTRYLSAEDILVIHALVIDSTGGSHGVRDPKLLESIICRPQAQFGGREMYVDVVAKAAALSEAIINYHVFVDGNKRTGFVALARFLSLNGYEFAARNRDIEMTTEAVAKKDISFEEFCAWIKDRVKETQE